MQTVNVGEAELQHGETQIWKLIDKAALFLILTVKPLNSSVKHPRLLSDKKDQVWQWDVGQVGDSHWLEDISKVSRSGLKDVCVLALKHTSGSQNKKYNLQR